MEWLDRILLTGKWAPVPLRPPDGFDAERITAGIKDKARNEAAAEAALARSQAEAEAARIVAQARLVVHQIEVKAEITAREEAQSIISIAKREAAGIEIEARERAFQFLVQTSQEIEREVGEAYRLALSRLSTSMLGLSDESLKIDAELKSKMARLVTIKTLELQEAKTALLGTSEVTVSSSPGNIAKGKTSRAAAPPQNVTGKKAKKSLNLGVKIPWRRGTPPVMSEEPAEPVPQSPVSSLQSPVPSPQSPVPSPQSPAPGPQSPTPVPSPQPPIPTMLEVDDSDLYTGEVELVILPPADIKLASRLYNYLQAITDLKVLYTRGSWDQGTTIAVVLEKPVALIKVLTSTKDLVVTVGLLEEKEGGTPGKAISLFKRQNKGSKRLGVTLKEKG